MSFIREFRQDPLRYQVELERRGLLVHPAQVLTQKFLFLSEPAAIQHVMQTNARNYRKDPIAMRISILLGNGLLTSDGNHWRKQRRLMQPAFHAEHVEAYAEIVRAKSRAFLARWRERLGANGGETELDVHREMTEFTLEVAGEAFFGNDLRRESLEEFWWSLEWILKEMDVRLNHRLFNLPLWIPTPSNRRLSREIAVLDRLIDGILDAPAGPPSPATGPRNLLSVLMSSTDEERMSRRELRDEILTLCLAGHETTAGLLGWTLHELAKSPAVAARLREEVLGVTGGGEVEFAHLSELPLARRVLMETMRLYPPAWMLSRQAIGDDEILGSRVSKGTIVIAGTYAVQRSARFWADPERFDPDRFVESSESKARPKFAYFPFGGGPRICIGSSFAMMEATSVLASLASSFEFRPGSEAPKPATRVTLRPEKGVRLRVRAAAKNQ